MEGFAVWRSIEDIALKYDDGHNYSIITTGLD